MRPSLKRLVIGRPLKTSEEKHQRLGNFQALAIFGSDPLSSVAYATEEILLVLATAGAAALSLSIPVALAIAFLFAVVGVSYRQTIMAYPSGGGAYIVAKDNLGTLPALVAAAALLTDYVMTVAVSVAAGVAALTSAVQQLYPYRVEICLFCVGVIVLGNLRGVRESGAIFSVPTYFFLVGVFGLIVVGMVKVFFLHTAIPHVVTETAEAVSPIGVFLLLKAFSSGCVALTGLEAISNGIPAFKPPEAVNARTVLTVERAICIFMFVAITVLAHRLAVVPTEAETVVSQIARGVFGSGFFYYWVQAGTVLILILAANTSFTDFPRLSGILARARFMPRQMANLGDRLALVNGIAFLGFLAGILLVVFQGSTTRLIPLYAVGVFLSFTLSQLGMVVHWFRLRGKGWKYSAFVNGLGAVTTATVMLVTATMKFTHGAYIVVLVIPLLVFVFFQIHHHYENVGAQLRVENGAKAEMSPLKNRVFLPVSGITTVSLNALRYGLSISQDVTLLFVSTHPENAEKISEQVRKLNLPVKLKIVESPFRSVIRPLVDFIEEESRAHPEEVITVVVPEFVPRRKWHYFLHNQTAILLFAALRGHDNVVITSVRNRLQK